MRNIDDSCTFKREAKTFSTSEKKNEMKNSLSPKKNSNTKGKPSEKRIIASGNLRRPS